MIGIRSACSIGAAAAIALSIGACAAAGSTCDCDSYAPATSRFFEVAGDSGTISGIVLEAERLTPIRGAQVTLGRSDRYVLSDSLGMFTIRREPSDSDTLRVQLLGYRAEQFVIPPGSARAWRAMVLLNYVTLDGCGYGMGEPDGTVGGSIVDAVAGGPPKGTITLEVVGMGRKFTSTARDVTDEWAWLGVRVTESGRYTITVRAPGYAEWRLPNALVDATSCRLFYARLEPM